jgi:hypothetical protein
VATAPQLTPQQLEEQAYLESGYSASSGVDATLLNTPSLPSTNAIIENLDNLQLPATQSVFSPDYTDYLIAGQPTTTTGGGVTQILAGVPTVATSSDDLTGSFSLFGLPTLPSVMIVAAAYVLLLNYKPSSSSRKGKK